MGRIEPGLRTPSSPRSFLRKSPPHSLASAICYIRYIFAFTIHKQNSTRSMVKRNQGFIQKDALSLLQSFMKTVGNNYMNQLMLVTVVVLNGGGLFIIGKQTRVMVKQYIRENNIVIIQVKNYYQWLVNSYSRANSRPQVLLLD